MGGWGLNGGEEKGAMSSAVCAIVLNRSLPPGRAANAAAVLAASVGRSHPEIIGPDVRDGSGEVHPGITSISFPILRADTEGLKALLLSGRQAGLGVCGFTDLAQGCHHYDEYTARMAATPGPQLSFAGVSLFGQRSAVKMLTGGLSLYR
jgi:hypothetical protein